MADNGFVAPTTVPTQEAGWFASDPFTDIGTADTNDTRIQTYDRYALSSSGAFPDFFPQVVNRNNIQAELMKFTPDQIIRLKQRLWAAGYIQYRDEYGKEVPQIAPPTSPQIDTPFLTALNNLTHDAATQVDSNGSAMTMDALINQGIQNRSSVIRSSVMEEFDLTSQAESLQKWALNTIGRNLRDDEVQNLFNIVGASDTSAQSQARSSTNPFGSAANDVAYESEPLTGGGADSKAINYLKNLANVYGTTVLSDFDGSSNSGVPAGLREGRGVVVGGSVENLTRLKQWADSQKVNATADSPYPALFETVQLKYENGTDKDPTGLYLAVNDLARAPIMSGVATTYQSFGDQTARFLEAIKRPGGDRAYNWEGDGVRRGAYGLSDEIWNYYTTMVFKNIPTNDHSAAAQDAVARAYAQDLFSGDQNFQNWRTVAIAFIRNEDAARNDRDGRRNEGDAYRNPFLDDAQLNRVAEVVKNMASVAPSIGGKAGKDPYTMLYGEGGLGVPTVSDPYAGRPRNDSMYNDKLMRAARSEYLGEATAASSFNKILSVLQNYDSSVMGGQ